jgi:hypothetical protein
MSITPIDSKIKDFVVLSRVSILIDKVLLFYMIQGTVKEEAPI